MQQVAADGPASSGSPAVYDSFNRRSRGEIKFLRRRALRRGDFQHRVIYYLKFYDSSGRRRNKILRVLEMAPEEELSQRLSQFHPGRVQRVVFFLTLRKWIFVYL